MRFLFFIFSLLISTSALAADSPDISKQQAEKIRAAIPSLKIDAITKSPIDGLYELQVGRQIFYSDPTGAHLISGGHIFDIATRQDLTKARLEKLNSIDWNSLPLDKAILSGDKKSKLKVAIFTDPDCPYCRKLEHELVNLKGVAVYTFLFPLEALHPDARAKSVAIWCSKDRHQALVDVMVNDKTLKPATCENPIADIITLAQKLNINGTPALIAGDGRIASGGKPAAALKAWLEKN